VRKTLLILPPSPLKTGIKVVLDDPKLGLELLFVELLLFDPVLAELVVELELELVLAELVALNPGGVGMVRKSPVRLASKLAGKLFPGICTVKAEPGIVVPRNVVDPGCEPLGWI